MFIRLTTNVSLFTAVLNFRKHINATLQKIAIEPTSKNWKYKKEISKKCLCKYLMHKSQEKVNG